MSVNILTLSYEILVGTIKISETTPTVKYNKILYTNIYYYTCRNTS